MNGSDPKGDLPVDDVTFAFGSFRLIPAQRVLLEDGRPLRLGSRAFDIFVALVERAGEMVDKDQLIARAWPDTVVDEGALRVHIAALRRALGDGRNGNRFISNSPGRGYSFVGPVTRELRPGPAAPVLRSALAVNLPTLLTRVIGRTETIATVVARLAQQRFLTIVGPGGIGKTTVAIAAAEALSNSYADGVWFVGLGSLQDPVVVTTAISAAVGGSPGVGDPLNSLVAWLRDKRALIILDNCEHVISAAATAAETMLRAAPHVAVLATSREPLRAEGEWLLRLPSLQIPPTRSDLTAAEALRFPAVELFNERALAALDSFVLDDANAPLALEICRHLDGVPLAIELAAAQVDVLGLMGLSACLDDRLAVLTRGRRTALPRQQTLRATIDWSYELLSETERRLLCRLAVFPAGFTLEAAAAVMSDNDDGLGMAGEGIASLVAKSLVSRDGPIQTGRWRLLETIRAYALEKLAESGDANHAACRQAEFFRDVFTSGAPGSRLQPSAGEMVRFDREIDNVRAALDWCFSPAGDRVLGVILSAVCAPAWLHSALLVECRERTERALDSAKPGLNLTPPLEMQLHLAFGLSMGLTMGSVERAKTALAKSIELAESLDDREAQLRALWGLWALHLNIGECRISEFIVDEFSRVARHARDQAAVSIGERLLGFTLQHAGQNRKAQQCFEHMLKRSVAASDRRYALMVQLDQRVLARAMLARVLWLQGYVDQAIAQARMSLEEAQAADYKLSICEALRLALCPVALMTGDFVTGQRAVAMLIDLANSSNAGFWKILARCLEGKLLIIHGEFGAGVALLRAEFDACESSGWAICHPEFMGVLAEGLAGLGRFTEALAMVDKALAKADLGGEYYYVPELLRIKGEILLQEGGGQSIPAAVDCFEKGIAVAQEQDALFWELRAALSLARMCMKRNWPDKAKQILAPVYDRFTEGFETADLLAARNLLEQSP